MIKARGVTTRNGKRTEVVILGFSHGNLDRLRDGKPIQFDGTPYGFAGDVLLIAASDERALAAVLGVDPDAPPADLAVHIEPGAP